MYGTDEYGGVYRIDLTVPRRLSAYTGTRGYLMVCLSVNGKRVGASVHRLVAMAWWGDSPYDGAVVRHLNDVKTDNRAENLAWGSAQDNAADVVRNGNRKSKLSEEQVVEIRTRHAQGEAANELAREFGVTSGSMHKIVTGKCFAELPGARDTTCRRRLTEDVVRACHIRHQNGETYSALAREFGVTPSAMRFAVSGRTWQHVK